MSHSLNLVTFSALRSLLRLELTLFALSLSGISEKRKTGRWSDIPNSKIAPDIAGDKVFVNIQSSLVLEVDPILVGILIVGKNCEKPLYQETA